ncbi:hypothetical protein LIER_05944 [Lithospermum erythrorhizon]|uniref:Uncharacterized protein n=1 Tax=Lithospermum erythrorhizon TaxID=34254 RepID=A0AAV3P2G3_LITER
MVKTRRILNTSGKVTKGKKNGVGTSDDTCMEIDPPIVNVKVQKGKTPFSTSTSGVEGPVLDVIPIRSIPPVNAPQEGIQEEVQPKIHNFYLPWVDYTKVRELDNPRPEAVDMTDPPANPSVDDTMGKSAEPSCVSEASAGDFGKNVTGSDGVDVSHSDTMTEDVEVSNTEGLGGAVVRPYVDDFVKDTGVDSMDADTTSVADIEHVTAVAIENVTPSVTDTGADTVGQDGIDTVDADI